MNEAAAPRTPQCLSQLALDRLLAGELTAAHREVIERHLAGCVRCAVRRGQREQEQRAFRESWSPPAHAGAPKATIDLQPLPAGTAGRGGRPRWRTAVARAGTLAAAAVVLLLAWPLLRREAPETTTPKGEHWLRYFVRDRASGAVRRGMPAENVRPGDALRFGFDPFQVGDHHVAVLGRDGAGEVSVYFPERGGTAARPPRTEDGLVPWSIVLDDEPGAEIIYALACSHPLPLGPLADALRRSETPPAIPAGCKLERITLMKRTGP
jgi:Putative zinc-finger